jgi:CHAD domain-containing protein
VTDVVQGALSAGLERLRRHAAVIPLSDDPEDVHQARVATRRLRSDLRTFRPVLDQDWVARVRAELKWLGEVLGAVRDADVLDERLRRQIAALPDAGPADAEAASILQRLSAERSADHAALVEALTTDRYVNIVNALERAAAQPHPEIEPTVVRKPWKHLHKAVKALGPEPADEALHEVRKKAKQCRYALEAVAPVVGDPATDWAKAVAGVQSVLGDVNDAVVAERWLRAGERSFLAGELVVLERNEAAASRAAWPDAWKQASHKKLRSWL